MKLLLWSALIIAAVVYFMKRGLGVSNNLTAHFQEQTDLQKIGNTALQSSNATVQQFPLTTLGDTPYAGMSVDPVNPTSPFAAVSGVKKTQRWQSNPAVTGSNPIPLPNILN